MKIMGGINLTPIAGDMVIIRHKTKEVTVIPGFTEKKGFNGKFVCFPDCNSIKLEMVGKWFPNDPEITKCELTFELTEYVIDTVISSPK